jgi:hypothetical protein
MRWDYFIEFWTARLLADPALVSVMGSASGWIYPAQSARPVTVPSVEYTLITDTESELFNPIGIQVDLWARGIKKAAQIERRIRVLTHGDTGQDLGGERVWMRYRDARTLDYPSDAGVIHRTLDFEFEAVRGKYVGQ